MIRGIRFEVPNKRFPVFYYITKGIDIERYFWRLVEEDVHKGCDRYFKKDEYSGEEFKRIISEEDCYAVLINLQAYQDKEDVAEINNYGDFLKSKCEMVLFISDNSYIDVYIKNMGLVDIVKKNAENNKFVNIKYITEENDIYKDFHV